MAGCPLLTEGQSSMTINGEETLNTSRYPDKHGTGETGSFPEPSFKVALF